MPCRKFDSTRNGTVCAGADRHSYAQGTSPNPSRRRCGGRFRSVRSPPYLPTSPRRSGPESGRDGADALWVDEAAVVKFSSVQAPAFQAGCKHKQTEWEWCRSMRSFVRSRQVRHPARHRS